MFYRDVAADHWYYPAVEYVFQNQIMTGLSATRFGPSEQLVRAQFATILHRMQGSPQTDYTDRFPDVTTGQFYTSAVLWASQKEVGIINGYDDTGCFGPSDQITREQLVTMMYRYAEYVKADTTISCELDGFADFKDVTGFAQDAMKWAVGVGVIQGDNGKLNPQGNANRAECATIIMRFMKYLEEHPAKPDTGETPDAGETPDNTETPDNEELLDNADGITQ